jgi:hypothetical protein
VPLPLGGGLLGWGPHGVGYHEHGFPLGPGPRGEAERGHTRVDPEHAGIEHLFSLFDAWLPVKHPRG